MKFTGKFIVIDGPDGGGKGTVLERLERHVSGAGGAPKRVRDPGGTEIGDRIRHVLLDHDLSKMDPRCETLLFMASRAQLVGEIVKPALAAGQTVLGDRFISATCAYQGAAGMPQDEIITVGRAAVGDLWPHLTIILDLPPELGFERTGRKPHHATSKNVGGQLSMFSGASADAMERRPIEYHRRVRAMFRELPAYYPGPVVIIDASRDAESVWRDVQEAIERAFQ